MKYRTVCITGGAGFVGSNLACRIKQDAPRVRVIALDNLKRKGSHLNLDRLNRSGVEFLHADIRNPEDLRACPSFDLMIECSAEPSVLAGYRGSPLAMIQANLSGTVHCLERVREEGADLVFLSTSRVYPLPVLRSIPLRELGTRFALKPGKRTRGVGSTGFSEDLSLEGPRSLYGATKLASEILIREYVDMYSLNAVINRCSILTGPWQMGKVDQGVVVLWMAAHFFGRPLNYIGYGGEGKQVRDLLHVEDLYRLLKIQLGCMKSLRGRIFNVGGGMENSVSLCELTALCRDITGNTVRIGSRKTPREGDVPFFVTDFSRVMQTTRWKPRFDIRRTLEDIHEWIRTHADTLEPILRP